MRLRAPPTGPPIVLADEPASTSTPAPLLPIASVPVVSVPIRLPWTRLLARAVDLDAVRVAGDEVGRRWRRAADRVVRSAADRSPRRRCHCRWRAVPAASVPIQLPATTLSSSPRRDLDAVADVAGDDVARPAVPPIVLPWRRCRSRRRRRCSRWRRCPWHSCRYSCPRRDFLTCPLP